jgi:peptidoglycan endopeptidase LytE
MGISLMSVSWGLCLDVQADSTYTVRQVDTLSAISERIGVTTDALRQESGISFDRAWTVDKRNEEENAEPFGHWSNSDEQRMLVKVALCFLGAPYRLGGSSVRGLDCSGLVRKIYQVFNIDLPRTAYAQSMLGLSVKRSELVAGDLIFFNTSRRLGHVGIYIGNNEFVHASSYKRMVSVDKLSMPYFAKRFVRAVRLKGNYEGE